MDERCISFSLHAIDVIEERGIMVDWVARVIAAPALVRRDPVDPALIHAYAPVPEREGRVLRVVYNSGADSIWVVTVFFDRSMRGEL